MFELLPTQTFKPATALQENIILPETGHELKYLRCCKLRNTLQGHGSGMPERCTFGEDTQLHIWMLRHDKQCPAKSGTLISPY